MARRIQQGVTRGASISLTIDGEVHTAREGETLASLLLLANNSAFYTTASGQPRAPFCNMGSCFECRVHIVGYGWVLACMTPAEQGMAVTTGAKLPCLEVEDDAN